MSLEYVVEICTDPNASNHERGSILESFAATFLKTQGFKVTKQVRLTGMEVDLLCEDEATGETILVECKAYRSNISSEFISKLLGNVSLGDYSSGWLICTHSLGKDAKGIEFEWSKKSEDKRRRLRILPPDKLIPRLIGSSVICDPKSLSLPSHVQATNEAYLLISQRGTFWAMPLSDSGTGVAASAALFDARSGDPVVDGDLPAWLSQTDTSLRSLTWITTTTPVAPSSASKRLHDELQNIVRVPMADHWADYRPARPIDFVGRETTLKEIFSFFDAVRQRTTQTRLAAIKAPSGWGKSSSVLKIADRARSKAYKSHYFVHAVDSRAANSERFPELALIAALRAAMKDGFIHSQETLRIGSPSSVFSSESVAEICRQLKQENKIICLFFDQFEELLYKNQLSEVFDSMRKLCSAVEEAQDNIIIGFSWKTDGTITTEHGAYHLWHELADRRREIDLPPFSEREVSLALGKFAKELGEPLAPQLRRLLEDHCQGFPWLLKKLCIHVLDLVKSGADQGNILASNMDIISLFRRDLENLTSSELACVKQIAAESPAEFFKISQTYDESILNSLINRRLVIRSGVRLTLYWDIFRDYVLNERIPYIPITYTPQANFSLYVKALRFLTNKEEVTYGDLSTAVNLTGASTDNLVRDLANLGHVEASRKEGTLRPLFDNEGRAAEIAYKFWRSHDVVRRLDADFQDTPFSEHEFGHVFEQMHRRRNYATPTMHVYAARTFKWLTSLGIIQEFEDGHFVLELKSRPLSDFAERRGNARRSGIFMGDAPPEAVCRAVQALKEGSKTRESIQKIAGRNAINSILALGIAVEESNNISIPIISDESSEVTVLSAAIDFRTVRLAVSEVELNPAVKGPFLGSVIEQELGSSWSEGTRRRYGGALLRWAKWCIEVEKILG